jgi:DNA-binding GntR family transcriptional regulator
MTSLPVPRYREIADRIQSEIAAGKWPVGEKLAPEQALASQFDVSRFTIREAMSRLEESGLVSRQRRLGTIVTATQPVEQMVQKLGSMDELLQYAPQTRLKPVRTTIVEADVALAQMLPCSVGTRWARIETVRVESKRSPVCWSDIYVPAEYAAVAERIGKDSTPVFQLMEQTHGLMAADINAELFAGSLSQRKAEALEVAPGSPALIIVRRYRDANGRLFEVSVSEHPAGRFSYSVDLKRKQGSLTPP